MVTLASYLRTTRRTLPKLRGSVHGGAPTPSSTASDALIVGRARQVEQPGVADRLVLAIAHPLRRAQVRMEQSGMRLGHMDTQDRAPRTAPQDDLPLAEAVREVGGQFGAVVAQLPDRQRRIGSGRAAAVGHAGSSLVPLRQREVPGPCAIHRIGVGAQRIARTPMEKQDDRIGAAVALHGYPLLDAADRHESLLVDLLLRRRARGPRHRGRRSGIGHRDRRLQQQQGRGAERPNVEHEWASRIGATAQSLTEACRQASAAARTRCDGGPQHHPASRARRRPENCQRASGGKKFR